MVTIKFKARKNSNPNAKWGDLPVAYNLICRKEDAEGAIKEAHLEIIKLAHAGADCEIVEVRYTLGAECHYLHGNDTTTELCFQWRKKFEFTQQAAAQMNDYDWPDAVSNKPGFSMKSINFDIGHSLDDIWFSRDRPEYARNMLLIKNEEKESTIAEILETVKNDQEYTLANHPNEGEENMAKRLLEIVKEYEND